MNTVPSVYISRAVEICLLAANLTTGGMVGCTFHPDYDTQGVQFKEAMDAFEALPEGHPLKKGVDGTRVVLGYANIEILGIDSFPVNSVGRLFQKGPVEDLTPSHPLQ